MRFLDNNKANMRCSKSMAVYLGLETRLSRVRGWLVGFSPGQGGQRGRDSIGELRGVTELGNSRPCPPSSASRPPFADPCPVPTGPVVNSLSSFRKVIQ